MKYLTTDEATCLEQMYARLLNFVGNYYWQCYNVLIILNT